MDAVDLGEIFYSRTRFVLLENAGVPEVLRKALQRDHALTQEEWREIHDFLTAREEEAFTFTHVDEVHALGYAYTCAYTHEQGRHLVDFKRCDSMFRKLRN